MRLIFFIFLMFSTLFAGPYHQAIQYIFPLPDSEYNSVATTIILRLGDEYHQQPVDISKLFVVTISGDTIKGETFWSTDDRTIIFKPFSRFALDEIVDVKVDLEQFGQDDFSYTFVTAPNLSPEVAMLASVSGEPDDDIPDGENPIPVHTINDMVVPADFPRISVKNTDETAPGRLFYTTNFPDEKTGNYIIVCNNDGTPYFFRKFPQVSRTGNFTLQPNGLLTAFVYDELYYTVMDSSFEEVEQIRAGHGYETDNHELLILENNHVLLIARDRLRKNLSDLVEGGKSNCVVEANIVQELDADRNVIFEWRGWDIHNFLETYVPLTSTFVDFDHMNSIDVDYDGNLVVSSRDMNEFTKINRFTGETIWRMGGRHNQFTFLNDEQEPRYAHDFRAVKGKPNRYTLFDNRRTLSPTASRGVEYQIEPEMKTVKKVWEYFNPDKWYAGTMGSMQRLPNGNSIVDFPQKNVRMVELSPLGEEVFRLYSFGHKNYRLRRYEWNEKMDRPELFLENWSTLIRLIYYQFGDPDIQRYNIYYSKDGSDYQLLTSTIENYCDVKAFQLDNNTNYYFRVKSVNQNGQESGFSNIQTSTTQYIGRGENVLKNGNFSKPTNWKLRVESPASATGRIGNGSYAISVKQPGSSIDDVYLEQTDVFLIKDETYSLSFLAWGDKSLPIDVNLFSSDESVNYSKLGSMMVSRAPQQYTLSFTMESESDISTLFRFKCGSEIGTVYLDNVSLVYGYDPNLGDPVKINFQTAESTTPEGYLPDIGLEFDDRGNGYSYGWLDGDNEETRERNIHADKVYDTLNHMQYEEDRLWEIELPDGAYHVSLVAGDPGYTDQINELLIEDIEIADPDGEDNFDVYEVDVTVTDNFLTIEPGYDAENAKICFLEIYPQSTNVNDTEQPVETVLFPNYPNPFNPSTTIHFKLASAAELTLSVYNVLGEHVATLIDGYVESGEHTTEWKPDNLASGIYYIKLESDHINQTQKMLYLR